MIAHDKDCNDDASRGHESCVYLIGYNSCRRDVGCNSLRTYDMIATGYDSYRIIIAICHSYDIMEKHDIVIGYGATQ